MKNKLFLLLLVVCSVSIYSQNKSFKISGTVTSEIENQPLEAATIYLERVKDSSLVTYTISDKEGRFSMEDKTYDDSLNIYISYVGLATYFQNIKVDKEEIDLGTIKLKPDANALDEVVLTSRAPITIKKDTLEFNVKSFKTKKDATVEDLLKKLPGVEVDAEGKITVNGKEVNKILVNGKPFFGNDPTITTRNLTKEIIEKVQVTDTKTDAEAFAGEDSDGENKTINLTIKEENNKGVFGRVAAGGGTDERYMGAGLFNRFDNDQRISILAGGNNVNESGFSFGEIRKMFGGANSISVSSNGSFNIDGRSFGGGSGIVTSRNAGANYADNFGEGLDISADYFYGGGSSEDRTSTQRENILPDRRFFTNSSTRSTSDNDNHSMNAKFDIKIDSTLLINIRPSARYTTNTRNFSRTEESLNEENIVTNNSDTRQFDEGENKNFNNNLDVTKKFGSDGASLRVSITNEFEKQEGEDFIQSTTNVFGDNPETIVRDQFTDSEQDFRSFYGSVNYTHPIISKKLFVYSEFSYRNDVRENIESTFDFDENTMEYSSFNTDLSTNFKYTNSRISPKLGVRYRGEKASINISSTYVKRTLENEDALRPETTFERDFDAIEARVYGNYRFNKKVSMYVNYNISNTPPSVTQLQPFQDVSDPLNIVTGNPNLRPSNEHRMYAGFNAYDWQKRTGFNLYVGANLSYDRPTSKTVVDENFVRTTTFENVDGNYNGYVSGSYSKNIKLDTIRNLRWRVRLGANTNQSVNFFDGEKYNSQTNSLSPNLRLTFTWDKVFEIEPSYGINYSINTFDLDAFKNVEFVTHNLGIETATFLPKKLEWRNDINYNYNPNVAAGFQRSVWFWNSTLAYSILKDKGTITLKAYDILKQNNNARRTATQNFIQDSQSLVLQQYFMLSFSWKFNSLGKKGETSSRGFFFD